MFEHLFGPQKGSTLDLQRKGVKISQTWKDVKMQERTLQSVPRSPFKMATVHPSRMGFISESEELRHPTQATYKPLSSRRLQREKAVVNVWPPSPKGPSRELYASFFVLVILSFFSLMCNIDLRNEKDPANILSANEAPTPVVLLIRKRKGDVENGRNGRRLANVLPPVDVPHAAGVEVRNVWTSTLD